MIPDTLNIPAHEPKQRWYHPTPGHLLIVLLDFEGILFLAEHFQWMSKGWPALIAIASIGAMLSILLLWFLLALAFRLRFQYSMRFMLLLTVAVALPFSWLSVEMKKATEQRLVLNKIRRDISVTFYPDSRGLSFLTKTLGDEYFGDVIAIYGGDSYSIDSALEQLKGFSTISNLDLNKSKVSDRGMKHIHGFPDLTFLRLDDTQITDAGFESVKGLAKLDSLSLINTPITDAGLKHIVGLSNLRSLKLDGTQITDDSMGYVNKLNNLIGLSLENTDISDSAISDLSEMKNLRYLNIKDSYITRKGLEKLKKGLPYCNISR
jgi:hypothetical protein